MITQLRPLIAASTLLLCAACTSTPEKSADADYNAPKTYRTGSNIPTKDYGAANIDVASPDIINPINRPGGSAMYKKPGG